MTNLFERLEPSSQQSLACLLNQVKRCRRGMDVVDESLCGGAGHGDVSGKASEGKSASPSENENEVVICVNNSLLIVPKSPLELPACGTV